MVEHGSLVTRDEFELLSKNLSSTYFAIAGGIDGTAILTGAGFVAASNPFPHPICNFAICDDVSDIAVGQLRAMAAPKPYFNVYVSHFGREDKAMQALANGGFRRLYTLQQMMRPPVAIDCGQVLERAETYGARARVGEFMVSQFFSGQNASVRSQISTATARASDLDLYEFGLSHLRRTLVGAVMLHRTPGVVGLYSLCVSQPFRLQGYGAAIVEGVERIAFEENALLGLQCDIRLEAWYQRLELIRIGTVDVYGLER